MNALVRCTVGLGLATLCAQPLCAQQDRATRQQEGLRQHTPTLHALVGATVVTGPGQRLENATVLLENGIIRAVGKDVQVPAGAQVHNLAGKWVYPGFIDPYTHLLSEPMRGGNAGRGDGPQYTSTREGAVYWNDCIRPETDVLAAPKLDTKLRDGLRGAGFTLVQAAPNDGLLRGAGVALLLGAGDLDQNLASPRPVASHVAFSTGSSTMEYPSSLMGIQALLRQVLLDADWYQQAQAAYAANPAQSAPEVNLSLAALLAHRQAGLPFVFEANTPEDALRMAAIAAEFGLKLIVKGSGFEYEWITEVAATKTPFVLPLNFPVAFDVTDPADAAAVSLAQLRRWEQAPLNPYTLHTQNIPFAFTTHGLKEMDDFWKNLRRAIAYGLPPDNALAALTTTPAELLGLSGQVGTLAVGKRANLVVASGDLFATEASVEQTWVAGERLFGTDTPAQLPLGTWNLSLEGKTFGLAVTGNHPSYTTKATVGSAEHKSTLTYKSGLWVLQLAADTAASGYYQLKGVLSGDALEGQGTAPNGAALAWRATRTAPGTPEVKAPEAIKPIDRSTLSPVTFPNVGYGFAQRPTAETVLFKGMTVWTNTAQGRLTNADVLIQNGKIAQVGTGLTAPRGARVVEGQGLHLTTGIIDEHTHIGLESVNEGSQANSGEVRMADVVDAKSIQFYRQLAGGVTAAQQLHGSANPIGGQSSIVKFRWGQGPEGLRFAEAPGFIKFALGENVKQSNWGDAYRSRYPQTRLGVEQFIADAFTAALDYRAQWQAYQAAGGKASNRVPPRKDLELECMLEILDSKRFITCHSYVQSEITMLLRLCERFGFKLNTLTHILEGYKVADKMAAQGTAGSTFADWWAYKYEVYEAMPYNPALMTQAGVVVAINSDDAEMARRLNQEAAKSVKYAGMSEEEAWKMVTLNPAKMLHVDAHVGTVEPGKHADLVVWTANPLSVYARPRQTYVDGVLLFDQVRDTELRAQIQAERARLIQKLLVEKAGGAPTQKPERKRNRVWHCNDLDQFIYLGRGATYEADSESDTEAQLHLHRGDH